MSRQLAFDLAGQAAHRRADFFVSSANAAALALMDAGGWPQGMLVVTGPEGSGKTHLAQIWAEEAGAVVVAAAEVGAEDVPLLAEAPALVVEDAAAVAGDAGAEAALFHLFNMARARAMPVVWTARAAPRDWGLGLADLASRMQSLATARLEPPDDALLAAVLVKLFADRQVTVAPGLIRYLVARMDRSFAAARALVAEMDGRAMARGGPISRADAAALLACGGDAGLDRGEGE